MITGTSLIFYEMNLMNCVWYLEFFKQLSQRLCRGISHNETDECIMDDDVNVHVRISIQRPKLTRSPVCIECLQLLIGDNQ